MSFEIDQALLDEINIYLNKRAVEDLNDAGLSFEAMAFILQTLINKVNKMQDELDKAQNI